MKTLVHLWVYLTQLFLDLEIFLKKCLENKNRHFMFNNFFFWKSCSLSDNVEKHCRAGQATDGNMAHVHCKLYT